ncbi:hypothetical protein ACFQX6_24430 [Streptosporangium lutulentum]
MSVPKGRRAVLTGMLALMSVAPLAGGGPIPQDTSGLWPGAATVVRGEHSLVIGHGVPYASLRDLASRADRARRAVEGIWGPVRAVILFPATDAEAAALAGARHRWPGRPGDLGPGDRPAVGIREAQRGRP